MARSQGVVPAVCIGTALVVGRTGLPDAIRLALDLTGLTVVTHAPGDDDAPQVRPDILLHVDAPDDAGVVPAGGRIPSLRIAAAGAHGAVAHEAGPATVLDPDCAVDHAFLVIRSLIRRERPGLLFQARVSGTLTLQEDAFRLIHAGRSAALTQTDICLLGPFFDLHDAVLGRTLLSELAFGDRCCPGDVPLFNVRLSRVRNAVIRQIGHDPLRTVRGVGCVLNDR